MSDKYEIGDWIKVLGEDDDYIIKSVDIDAGYVEVQDVTGHTWYTAMSTIVRKLTKKEVYGVTEKTTADEFNKEIQIPPGGEGSHQEEANDAD
jgi:hypothetical protein